MVFRNLERAEDISRAAMLAGIKWRWETFPEFLDVLETLPKGINYAGYMGHCALRTYVMGQRAFTDEATEDDLAKMVQLTQGGGRRRRARLLDHALGQPPDLGRQAGREPPRHLARVRDAGEGDGRAAWSRSRASRAAPTATRPRSTTKACRKLAIESGRPITFGLFNRRKTPGGWRSTFDIIERTARGRAAACSPRCTAAR